MRNFQRIFAAFLVLGAFACSEDDDSATDDTTAALGETDMSFFVTSSGSGAMGANLGGVGGADERCEQLAAAVGAGAKTWRAYLSTTLQNARDRIGDGPWYNAKGDMIAADVASLHTNGLKNGNPQHMMDEQGNAVPGPEHDILTGSDTEGRVFMMDGAAHTCSDWSVNTGAPGPRVGHADIPTNPMFSPSWNNAHTPPGCDQMSLTMVGGAGRLYCFAE
ncbi:MAG: hypothetical protein RL033_3028 [Pseudomonadota bacterium]|jgi:hypothetical protein